MRVILAGALIALLLEAILLLAFWAGYAWLGGLWGGIALAAAVALLVVLCFVGDLEIEHDSAIRRTDVKVGWIARITTRESSQRVGLETRTRILFVSWSRAVPPRPDRPPPTARPSLAVLRDGAEPIGVALTAAATALQDLFWNARAISVRVQSPTGVPLVDQAAAGIFGTRHLGPIELALSGDRERRVVAHYRIRFFRAAFTMIAAFVQGQPDRVARLFQEHAEAVNRRGGNGARKDVNGDV